MLDWGCAISGSNVTLSLSPSNKRSRMASGLRRSGRLVRGNVDPEHLSSIATLSSYPDGRPSNEFEKLIAQLNRQSFPSQQYAKIDDIILYSLFSSKKNFTYTRRLVPSPALTASQSSSATSAPLIPSSPNFIDEHARRIYLLQKKTIPADQLASEAILQEASHLIVSALPEIFNDIDRPVVQQ